MDRFDWSFLLPPWFFPFWAALLGLLMGSFANVCIYRLPKHLSVVHPRSSCPDCGRFIHFYENIPVLSWILLRARCRGCGKPISVRYPLVESLTGMLFLGLALRLGPGSSFFVLAAFSLLLLILFFTDLETMLLPDTVTRTGTLLGLVLAPWNPLLGPTGIQQGGTQWRMLKALSGAALGALLVLAIMGVWRLWVRGRLGPQASEEERTGMGWGDLKMLALIGAFVGLRQVFFVTFLAAALGSLVGMGLILLGRGSRRMPLPFGTFLSLAGLAAVFFGRPVVAWYLSLLGLP